MKVLGWIRVGDRAACGGIVAAGHEGSRYNGVAYSFKGAQMNCPQRCVISEAIDYFTLPNGLKVPHHGHRTSAGCPLQSTANDKNGYHNGSGVVVPAQYVPDGNGGWMACTHESPFDLSLIVRDERTGQPMAGVPYRVALESGRAVNGRTDSAGRTDVVHSDRPEHATITVPYYGDVSTATDSSVEPDSCGC